jgi:hypothetical protein
MPIEAAAEYHVMQVSHKICNPPSIQAQNINHVSLTKHLKINEIEGLPLFSNRVKQQRLQRI